jgi:nitrate/nitrite transport system ATP-binding protein
MRVDLPRPRSRQALLEHPDYYRYREELLAFLERADGPGAESAAAAKAVAA